MTRAGTPFLFRRGALLEALLEDWPPLLGAALLLEEAAGEALRAREGPEEDARFLVEPAGGIVCWALERG